MPIWFHYLIYLRFIFFVTPRTLFFKKSRNLEKIFWNLFIINFVLCLSAIPLYFTSFKDLLWIQQYFTEGVDNFVRLKLFTYEASYYATLFTPLFFFYLVQIILKQNRRNVLSLLPMLFFALYPFFFNRCDQHGVYRNLSHLFVLFSKTDQEKKGTCDHFYWPFTVCGINGVVINFFSG